MEQGIEVISVNGVLGVRNLYITNCDQKKLFNNEMHIFVGFNLRWRALIGIQNSFNESSQSGVWG